MEDRIGLVTGGNRGLGFETCSQLAARGYRVVLTARDEAAANRGANELGVEHLQLDVTAEASLAKAVDTIRERYGRLDLLVNNAGVALNGFDADVAKDTLNINFFGTVAVSDALGPLLAPGASVVMVSSGMGQLSCLSTDRRRDFEDPGLSRDRLEQLMTEFISDVQSGEHASKGWPSSAYRVSKVGMNAFTRILSKELAQRSVSVNAVCPGWVQTDMGGAGADRSVSEGAKSILWAATAAGSASGGFLPRR